MSAAGFEIRLMAAVGFALLMTSRYGTSASPKVLTVAAGLLVLLPWLVSRLSLTVHPLTLLGALLGLIGVAGSGGNARLALMSFAALLPAGLIVGSHLRDSAVTRIVVSGSIAATQWVPIINQYRNPYLVLERLGSPSPNSGFTAVPFSQAEGLRPVGTTVSPGLVAFILLTAIALTTVPGLADRRHQVAMWSLTVGHICCLLLTGSRTGIASAAVLLAWRFRGTRRLAIALRAGALLGGILVVVALSASTGRVAPEARLEIIRAAIPTLRDHWLFGVGWANTPNHVSTSTDGVVYHLHSLPLHVLFELGLCGAAALALLSLQLARRSMLAILALLPFALADAGVFIYSTTVFFVGILIEISSKQASPVAPTSRVVATL